MNEKVFSKLELNKVLELLSQYAAFSGGQALAAALVPATDADEVRHRQQGTSEARTLLAQRPDLTLGGVRDVRRAALDAERGIVLDPDNLLDIKATLRAGTTLKNTLNKHAEDAPLLGAIAQRIDEGRAVVAGVGRILGPRGEVLDSASDKLGVVRHELRRESNRLQTKLQSIVSSSQNAPYLQEYIVTMRGGRYVIPVKAEHKGRFKGIVHDQSSSGATIFLEPLETVEISNRVRQLELDEEEEIHRILSEASALVGKHAPQIVETVEALSELDLAFAKAHYASAIDARQPELVMSAESVIQLYNARHPLLDPATVVPIDVEMEADTHTLIITGPNTGGKTVSLKTVGLLALMHQCGLHLPVADGSALTVFGTIFADIGDEQSIEQSLSTFSGHITNIIWILEQADAHSLVILDELGAGTDPTEGAALARAILATLMAQGATTLVATHYPELKLYGHSTAGVRNASVEFDLDSLAPTYRLLIGLPGRSNALAIASRLGLPDEIVEVARSMVGESDLQVEDMLEEIDRTRLEIGQTQARLEASTADANQMREELGERLRDIEEERRRTLEEAREAARIEIESMRAEVADLRHKLENTALSLEALESLDEQLDMLEEEQAAPLEFESLSAAMPPAPQVEPVEEHELQIGDRVFVSGLNAEGEILTLADNQAELQLGNMRLRADLAQLTWRSSPQSAEGTQATGYGGVSTPQATSPGLELHLRGQRVEEALDTLERYLDKAFLAGLPWVRIVHGKGTGKLRDAVREVLAHHPLVQSYAQAPNNEGGSGVTTVQFVPES